MEVRYDEDKNEWVVNETKQLPLAKPPPAILGFGNISIGFPPESNLEVNFFLSIEIGPCKRRS